MPVPLVPLAALLDGVPLASEAVAEPVPLVPPAVKLPEAETLPDVLPGVAVEAVVSVVLLLAELLAGGVDAVVVAGGVAVLLLVAVALSPVRGRSQPVTAAEANASAATRGRSFFMDFSIQSARV